MNTNGEVSLKDIIKRVQQIVRYLLSKWLIIVFVGIAGGILGFVYAWQAKPKYNATLNFVLSNNSTSGGGLMGLANQFGFSLGNDNDNVFSGDNIIALMKSRRMVQQALFSKPENSESLINIYAKDNKLNESWQQNAATKNSYPFPDDQSKMNLVQDSLSREIYYSLINNMLDVSKPDKEQSIYAVTTTATNPVFAYYLTKNLVQSTSSFYINTKTSTAQQNLNMLLKEADSLRGVLSGAITSAGSQTDFTFNLNPAYQVQRSGAQESQARAAALGQAYGQVLQNLELAKITLQKETPLYQVIDEPTLPLEADKPSKLLSMIAGGILAGFLICCVLIAIKVYKTFV